jgi:hypothetical protein
MSMMREVVDRAELGKEIKRPVDWPGNSLASLLSCRGWSLAASGWAWVALLLCLAYYFGFCGFPLAAVEGDAPSMAAGARQIVEHGWDGPRIDYGRETRPGLFWALIFLRWLTDANPYTIFSLLGLLAGLGFVLCSAWFVARYVALPVPLCAIAILVLFPDSATTAACPDGVLLAAFLWIVAMCLLARSTQSTAWGVAIPGALAGLATLSRLDAVLACVAALPLLALSRPRETIKRFMIFGGVAAAVFFAGFYSWRGSILEVLAKTQATVAEPWVKDSSMDLIMKLATHDGLLSCLVFFPIVTSLLILIGAAQLVHKRAWGVLTMVALGLLPIFLIYGHRIYGRPLYYTIPLFALPAMTALERLSRSASLRWGGVVALTFAAQYIFGINVILRSKPYYPSATPTLATLAAKDFASGALLRIEFVLGAGGAVPSPDGPRFTSGLIFHPLAFHHEKRQYQESFGRIQEYLTASQSEKPPPLVYTSNWPSFTQVNLAIQNAGFSCTKVSALKQRNVSARRFVWVRNGSTIIHIFAENTLDPWDQSILEAQSQYSRMVYVTAGGRERSHLVASGRVTRTVYEKEILGSGVMCLFEVRM